MARARSVALIGAALGLFVACSSASPRANEAGPTPSPVSASVSRADVPLATSTPVRQCDDATTEGLVRRFVSDFNAGAIDKVDSLFVPRGAGFRFLSTQKWGVEIDRGRVVPILQEFYQAGERISETKFGNFVEAGADGIGGAFISYGASGAIKFQIHCNTQLIAAAAWDRVDQPALTR